MTSSNRKLLLVVAAVALGVAAVVRAWFSTHGVSVGLWGLEVCDNGCHGVRWDNAGADLDIYLFGYLGVAAALATSVVTCLAALGERPQLMKLVRMMAMVSLATMVAFAVRILVEGGLSISWAAILGPVAAIVIRVLATDDGRTA
ncbi:MAG: hypothetical protein ABI175_26120 [Polyangiales bacterium]